MSTCILDLRGCTSAYAPDVRWALEITLLSLFVMYMMVAPVDRLVDRFRLPAPALP
jgi:hypothetical protein